jgi:diadenosine tetraphosphate (Ap4A) HIT family hydrolase
MNKILFPDLKVYEDEYFEIHQDFEVPISAFFILVCKRQELKSVAEFTDIEAGEFGKVLKIIRAAMREVLGIEDVYFFQNEDTEHGFHFWIFPRYIWMEKFGKKIQSVRTVTEYAKINMCDEKNMQKVREDAEKVREYLRNK